MIFLCLFACEGWSSKLVYSPCPDWSRARIRDSQVESRQSCLNRDCWTLCKGFREVRGHVPSEKNKKFEAFKLLEMHWNCQSYHHHVNFVLFWIFYDPIRSTFLALGGGGACIPHAPPAYRPTNCMGEMCNWKNVTVYISLIVTIKW